MTTLYKSAHLQDLSPHEVHELYKLRTEVFTAEQGANWAEADEIDSRETTWHVRAYDEAGRLKAYTRLFLTPSIDDTTKGEIEVRIGRVAVDKQYRGEGLGRTIIEYSLEMCKKEFHDIDIALEAQTHAIDFYKKHGFHTVGEVFDLGGIDHIKMVCPANDLK
ncbi:GNAT family N-acetyltransferase [Corynebacterium glucuronolyticum]|uniref:GNAT family N-acetyltransferase n=1 Tax=Corynebacterium glucuronolyticum TaxID=39791 RepID=UPI00191CF6F9|nr:GNAT family N-acetyltransferase [Corynebacterium glucuronolyticum]QQU88785.1 GNAT family N-acetyltransferase [Corynebacterium glucuronolyticum]